jgi:hypothetical protein
MRATALALDPTRYERHPLHRDTVQWMEKNCYFDVWIELIHALGGEPLAVVPVVAALDFEGDQWTFFKPPHDELRDLYGIEVNELNAWRPMQDHALEHLPEGKFISVEADAFWLPDVRGTDYRTRHVKSTIVLADVDMEARKLRYFHNASFFELEGEDFDHIFEPPFPGLPFFAELVRVDRFVRRPAAELATMSAANLRRHVARRPSGNPVERFADRFVRELPYLQSKGLEHYHAWAFATLRQLGSSSELMAAYVRWLAEFCPSLKEAPGSLDPAAEAYDLISNGAKAFILKAARAVNARRALDAQATFDEWAAAWSKATATLEAIP